MPPEGMLMASLGISRPTLREAFRILEAEKLISVVRGSRSGARVHRPSSELVSRYAGYVLESLGTTVADLYAARLAIEPTVVRWLAMARGKTPGMEGLKRMLAELEGRLTAGQYDEFIAGVSVFHQSLVEAAGNKTLSFMNRMLLDLARQHQGDCQRRDVQSADERLDSFRAGFKAYDMLIAMIERGEVEEAVAHWRVHLRSLNENWVQHGEGDRIVNSLHTA